jgi:cathepsin A (carboxypeptidase C)
MRCFTVAVAAAVAVVALACAAVSARRPAASGVAPRGTFRTEYSGWPACAPTQRQRSGYFTVNTTYEKNYFYWMIEAAEGNPATAPLLVFLSGGPGCSSSLALLFENGQCRVNSQTGALEANKYGWSTVANTIWVDQPAGVGFSYTQGGGSDRNEREVGDDMFAFVQAFTERFPQYKGAWTLVCESFGGQYCPAVAHRIMVGNQRGEGKHIRLNAVAMGNGLTQPTSQYPWYPELAYTWCKAVKGTPCVSREGYEQMKSYVPECVMLIKACNTSRSFCGLAQAACNQIWQVYQNTGLNFYDITKPCVGSLCYAGIHKVSEFMNRADVQQALIGTQRQWQSCNYTVNGDFSNDFEVDRDQLLADLANYGTRVVYYNGVLDFSVNWLGVKQAALDVKWPMQKAFAAASDALWFVDEQPAGQFRIVGDERAPFRFGFITIFGAGHLAPHDQPARLLEMVRHILDGSLFVAVPGPLRPTD